MNRFRSHIRTFALPSAVRAVPADAIARLSAKFDAARKRREHDRFWQAVQAMKQPENAQ